MRSPRFARYYRTLFALSGWLAMLVLWYSAVINRPEQASALEAVALTFRTFTVQTNTLVLIWYTAALLFWDRDWAQFLFRPLVKGAFTLYITVTFVIFFIVLQPMSDPQGVDAFINGMVHYVTPIAFIIDWILFEKKRVYQWRYVLIWLVYPVAYLLFLLSFGGLTGDYIYPFFDVSSIGWAGFATWVVILLTVFVVLGFMYVGLNRFWRRGGAVMESESHSRKEQVKDER